MEITFDLHTHSGYAGGASVGITDKKKRLRNRFLDASILSPLKGIDFLGTGDCQFKPWLEFLERNLEETANGVFQFNFLEGERQERLKELGIDIDITNFSEPKYLLQTEVIFTSPIGKSRKKAHVLILFPSFTEIHEFNALLDKWQVKHEKMARPFILNNSAEEVQSKIFQLKDLNNHIEIIPAHVMTPEGVYGGNNGANFLKEFFGEAEQEIFAVETGLSADPRILDMIPEMNTRAFISNADAHSSGLNKIGREFTSLKVNQQTYGSIIESIRKNRVTFTGELHPSEGRYFLSGHRDNRKQPFLHLKGQYCYFSPKQEPKSCPICKKPLTKGVLNRAYEIADIQGTKTKVPIRNYRNIVPLVEVIAHSLSLKSVKSKKVISIYTTIIQELENEVHLWQKSIEEIASLRIPEKTKREIIEVMKGNFSFLPPGHDGVYGKLAIGKKIDVENVHEVSI